MTKARHLSGLFFSAAYKPKRPATRAGRLVQGVPDNDLLSHGQSVLSSARRRFTVLFGMGRSGAGGLWSSGVEDGIGKAGWVVFGATHDYGVKPHGPLVPVSSTPCGASTPGLSTWW